LIAPLILWAAIVLTALLVLALHLSAAPLGPLTRHMGVHILLMNALAPLLAVAWTRWRGGERGGGHFLFAASATQIALLWILHAPPLMAVAAHEPAVQTLVQAALFASALWFWSAVFNQAEDARWRALFALLVTGKLFCLLAALLVFAPRSLYPIYAHVPAHGLVWADSLSDQQLAGLLMIVMCPLSYVVAAVVIAERWLRGLALAADTASPKPNR
jgi:putative membrane protein